ncbi:MAG: S-layer family protein [Nitrospirae bacterium]|nr:S-layer family protein [Nitrospirota bacterium]
MGRRRRGFGNCLSRYVLRALICLVALFSYTLSYSAIITDGTVGWGGTLVGPKFIIPASIGTTVGNNLFQSFSTFNIMTGESATFTGSSNIQNVIARVTGGSSSSIDGTLSCSISGANLYLINPAGVMFGKNATLDVKGSFYVSTADYLKLADGGRYDARTPSNSILTSAPPSAFGFLTSNPAGVTVTGALLQVPNGKTISIVAGDINITNGYLYAPGGQINLASVASTGEALMSSSGTNVDGFSALGNINMTQTDTTGKTINGNEIGNLDVSNQTGGSGSIYIRGGKFVIDNGQIVADTYGGSNGGGVNINITGDMNLINGGIIESDTAGNGNAGPINIKSGNLSVSGYALQNNSINVSGIYSSTTAAGNAGNINIETNNLSLTTGIIGTSSIGHSGNAGDINIKASDSINMSGYYNAGSNGVYGSEIISLTSGKGNAGSIDIQTNNLSLTDLGTISTTTRSGSSGNAGNIRIKASNTISISGYYDAGGNGVYPSGIISETYSTGDAGSIDIDTNNLSLTNAGAISTSARSGSSGNAGNISIKASNTINISGYYDADNNVAYPSEIVSETYGIGNAGSINIDTNNLSLTNAGAISTSARSGSSGNAGNISIKASDTINISGYYDTGNNVAYPSEIVSFTYSTGDAGSINIDTRYLSLINTGVINTTARTGSSGNAGNISIKASDTINISGYYNAGGNGFYQSGIYSQTYGRGDAGSINIETNNLNLTDTGVITTTAQSGSSGNAGSITIKALDTINISGYYDDGSNGVASSGIYSQTSGAGDAGSINIEAKNLSLTDAGAIDTSAGPRSSGNAGNISIKASYTINISGYCDAGSNGVYPSWIISETYSTGDGGSINIETKYLSLTDTGEISTSARSGSSGNAGNITIKASDSINISGYYAVKYGIYASGVDSETYGKGNAGSIDIQTKYLSLTNVGEIDTSSSSASTGKAGDIAIKASDTIKLDGESGIYSQTYGKGNAGAINIETKDLTIAGASEINTSARSGSSGNAGNITIIASDTINISGYYDVGDDVVYSSVIRSETYGKGNAGSIDIQTNDLSIANTGLISTSALSGSSGNAGDITIKASGSINISGYYDTGNGGIYSSGVYSETYGKGNAGSISVETNNLNITDLGTITTTAMPGSTGSGGNINIKASDTVDISGYYAVSGGVYSTGIYSETYGKGDAGSIDIETKNLTLTDVGTITTTSLSGSTGKSGNITIKASDSINITGYYDADDGAYVSGIYSETLGKGDAGSINIETSNLNISDAGRISTTAMSGSTGSGGNINIKASGTVNISGYYAGSDGFYSSGIYSETDGIGNAGSINVETSNLNLANTGLITTTARPGSTGSGGNINITASDTINISGYYAGSDSFYSSGIYSETSGKGSAGGINIETNNLSLTNAGTISTSADSGSTGNAGNITINASDSIYISNYFDTGKNIYSNGILSDTYGSGKAGDITILTKNLTLANVGKISTSAESGSTGSGGNISVLALGSINISGFYTNGYDVYQSGIYSETNSSGNAGDVTLLSRNLYIDDNGLITARSTGTGNAGNITIKTAETLQMNNGGDIATSSKYTTGGNIDIAAADIRLYNDSGITSNVSKGKDKGGNITILAGTLCLLDRSAISADADTGYGGDITINADTVFLWNTEKALHASSTISGQSGTITINSPLTDISGSMVALTPRYLEAEKLLPESCEARRKSKGSFVIKGLGNLSPWNSRVSF